MGVRWSGGAVPGGPAAVGFFSVVGTRLARRDVPSTIDASRVALASTIALARSFRARRASTTARRASPVPRVNFSSRANAIATHSRGRCYAFVGSSMD